MIEIPKLQKLFRAPPILIGIHLKYLCITRERKTNLAVSHRMKNSSAACPLLLLILQQLVEVPKNPTYTFGNAYYTYFLQITYFCLLSFIHWCEFLIELYRFLYFKKKLKHVNKHFHIRMNIRFITTMYVYIIYKTIKHLCGKETKTENMTQLLFYIV